MMDTKYTVTQQRRLVKAILHLHASVSSWPHSI